MQRACHVWGHSYIKCLVSCVIMSLLKAMGKGRSKGQFSVPAQLWWWRHIPQNTWRWETGDNPQTFVCHAVWDLVAIAGNVSWSEAEWPESQCNCCLRALLLHRSPECWELEWGGKARLPPGSSVCTRTSGQWPKISWERHPDFRVPIIYDFFSHSKQIFTFVPSFVFIILHLFS